MEELTKEQENYIENNLYYFNYCNIKFFQECNILNCIYILRNSNEFYVGATKNLKNRLFGNNIKTIHPKCIDDDTEIFIAYKNLKHYKMKEKEDEIINEMKCLNFNLQNKVKSSYSYSRHKSIKFKKYKNEFDILNVLDYNENYKLKSFYYEDKNDYVNKVTETDGFSWTISNVFKDLILEDKYKGSLLYEFHNKKSKKNTMV